MKIIRDVFEKTLKDETAIADAAKKKIEIDSSTAGGGLALDVTSQSPEIVGKMKKLLEK